MSRISRILQNFKESNIEHYTDKKLAYAICDKVIAGDPPGTKKDVNGDPVVTLNYNTYVRYDRESKEYKIYKCHHSASDTYILSLTEKEFDILKRMRV